MEEQDVQEVSVKPAGKPTELTKKERKKAENKFFKNIDRMDSDLLGCVNYLVNVEECGVDLEEIQKAWGIILECLYIEHELSPTWILLGECIECDKKAENEENNAGGSATSQAS
jgi:hypothetical protein